MKTPAVVLAGYVALAQALAAPTPAPTASAPAAAPAPVAAAPATPAPIPRPAPGASPGEILKSYRNSLVFVGGAAGNGSGFIATMGGVNYLVTNAHVAAGIKGAGFKRLDGSIPQLGAPSIAVGHDIFRLQTAPGGLPFEIMQGVEEKAAIGDEVLVLGNAEGAGVINLLRGNIIGIGPDRLEVDAPFQPGNSGSPIIHIKSGQVIGIATYAITKKYDEVSRTMLRTPITRRFGYRLDSVKTWQPVNPQAFFAQAAELQSVEALTVAFDRLFMDMMQNHKITPDLHTHPAIKTRINQWQTDMKRKMSEKDAAAADQNFLSFLKVTTRTDILNARPHMTYDYFQRKLDEENRTRTEMAQVFDEIIKDIQKSR
jgi:hypothetical protein